MRHKSYKWLAYVMLAVLLASPILVAADPKPAQEPFAFPGVAPQLSGETMSAPSEAELSAAPAVIQDVVALKESLTAEQQTAITAVLDKYMPEFDAIMAQMPGPNLPEPGTKKPSPAGAKVAKEAVRVLDRLDVLAAEMDAEFKAVLSPEQYVVHERALSPEREAATSVQSQDPWRTAAESAAPEATELTCTYCSYAGQYASIADRYAYYLYYYAYYCYYYCSYTSAYHYYAYAYAYNAYVTYGWPGFQRIGVGYFDCLAWHSDENGGISSSISYLYNAYYYSYYASQYAYYAYYYYGCSYCYYAYYYGYNYARYYYYYAYYYAYYCYNT